MLRTVQKARTIEEFELRFARREPHEDVMRVLSELELPGEMQELLDQGYRMEHKESRVIHSLTGQTRVRVMVQLVMKHDEMIVHEIPSVLEVSTLKAQGMWGGPDGFRYVMPDGSARWLEFHCTNRDREGEVVSWTYKTALGQEVVVLND
jgi:hypothetical protein